MREHQGEERFLWKGRYLPLRREYRAEELLARVRSTLDVDSDVRDEELPMGRSEKDEI